MGEEGSLIFTPGIKAQKKENCVNENCMCSSTNGLHKGAKEGRKLVGED